MWKPFKLGQDVTKGTDDDSSIPDCRRNFAYATAPEKLWGPPSLVPSDRDLQTRSQLKIAKMRVLLSPCLSVHLPQAEADISLRNRVRIGPGSLQASYVMDTRGLSLEGKAAGAWNWSLNCIKCRCQEYVQF
jgi:hypothetical protein